MSSRAAIYARVSTDDQTAEAQLAECRRYAADAGLEVRAEYVETESGARDRQRRPELGRMLRDARRRRFDALLVWSLDRLTREGVPAAINYATELDSWGVRLVSVREPYLDTRGPFGHVVLAILAELGAIERERIGERTRAGLERARADGATLGRPRKRDAIRADVARLHALGLSDGAIGGELGVSRSLVQQVRSDLAPDELEPALGLELDP